MNQILTLNGRINKDVSPLYVASDKGEVLERRNARVTSVDGGEMLLNVSLKGMQSIGTTTGLGTVVGFVEDRKRNWGIYFIQGFVFCGIYAYQSDTDAVIKIVSDVSAPFFEFGDFIEAKMIDDYLIWTDGTNPIRCIDVVRALAFTTGSTNLWKEKYYSITDLSTRLAIPTPTDEITATWGYNGALLSNNLAGKTWQFAIQYKYKGGEESVFSGYSQLYVHPNLLIYPSTADAIKSENYLRMNVPLGGTEVMSSLLMARENQGLWFLVKEFKKAEPTDAIFPNYDFYDSSVREYVSADIPVLSTQGVPLKCSRLETAKNRLILADITTNYDHPDISLALTTAPISVSKDTIINNSLVTTYTDRATKLVVNSAGMTLATGDIVYFGFDGIVDVRVQVNGSNNDFSAKYSYLFSGNYKCLSSSVSDMLTYFTARINDGAEDLIYKVNVYYGAATRSQTRCLKLIATKVGATIEITFQIVASLASEYRIYEFYTLGLKNSYGYRRRLVNPVNANTYIGGSGYNVGVEYYDSVGNTSGVEGVTSIEIPQNMVLSDATIPSYDLTKIVATVIGNPPIWAMRYRFVCSTSTSFASVASFIPAYIYVKTDQSISKPQEIPITSCIVEHEGELVTAIPMPNKFNYQFIKGDYVSIKSKSLRGGVINLESGIEVIGTVASVVTYDLPLNVYNPLSPGITLTGNFLLVRTTTPSLFIGTASVSIYRPLKALSDYVYFHASPLYDIVGGAHSHPTADLLNGDGWVVLDDFGSNFLLTSASSRVRYNPYYLETTELNGIVSNVNVGKPTISLKDFKQKRLQELWYGGQLIVNTGINALRDFSNIGRLAMSESDGRIAGLTMAGDVLKVVQYNRETSAYIGKEQITNADGTLSLIASQGFIGTINRYTSSYGSQHPQSVVTNDRDLYYFDLDNACVVRTAPNGQFPVSSYGWTSYFKEKSEQIRSSIINSLSHSIISYYDRRHNEYVIIFDVPTKSGLVITNHREAAVFDEATNSWIAHLDLTKSGLIPNMVGSVGQSVLSFTDSVLWLHERTTAYNTFYGEQKGIKITGVVNVSPATEKCLKAISIDANMAFETKISSPLTDNNVIGQETILYEASYNSKEGKWVSPVYQNILTTGGQNLDQLFVGDDMQGKYFKIELNQASGNRVELRNMGVNILPK